jgi:hypothetical protein
MTGGGTQRVATGTDKEMCQRARADAARASCERVVVAVVLGLVLLNRTKRRIVQVVGREAIRSGNQAIKPAAYGVLVDQWNANLKGIVAVPGTCFVRAERNSAACFALFRPFLPRCSPSL